jgi:hypothetical protein
MTHSLLDIGDHLLGIRLVPTAIERLGGEPELDHEIAAQIFRLDLTTLLAPQPDQGRFISAHDDASVRASDVGSTIGGFRGISCIHWHFRYPLSSKLPLLCARLTAIAHDPKWIIAVILFGSRGIFANAHD